jgi:hypothetical protein
MDAAVAPLSRDDFPIRDLVAAAIAKTGSPRRAAKVSGVEVQVIKTWLLDPDFLNLVAQYRKEPLTRTMTLMTRAAPLAVATLIKAMKSDSMTGLQIRAAKTLLENLHNYMQDFYLAERIEELERKLAAR